MGLSLYARSRNAPLPVCGVTGGSASAADATPMRGAVESASAPAIAPAARRRRRLPRFVTSRLLVAGCFGGSLGRELDGVVGVLGGGADSQRSDVVDVAGGAHDPVGGAQGGPEHRSGAPREE